MDSTTYGRMKIHDKRSCGFEARYNQAKAVGFVGTDTFYFKDAKTAKLESHQDIAFGCGLRNYDFWFGDNRGPLNVIAGIHGLAPGPSILFYMISILSQTDALSMKMIPIDSPHLQIFPQNLAPLDRHELLSNISISRALGGSTRSSNQISQHLYRAKSSYYITQLALGNGGGAQSPFLLLDTGSDETWVQCEGCNPCFATKAGNFRYMDSTTYARMKIDDQRCVPQKIFEGSCGFVVQYSQATTVGVIGTDTFYFKNAKTARLEVYQDIAFGCGLRNYNVWFGDNTGPQNIITGVHGIAPGPRSFLNQLDAQIQGRFLYCIPSWVEERLAFSTIYFGEDAQMSEGEQRQVQVISMNADKRYHLFLDGISVDGVRLSIDPSIFELDEQYYNKGFFIDSGAPYTTLARSAYKPLRDAIIQYFSKYGWEPKIGRLFDLCYVVYPSGEQRFPSVVLHFVHKNGEEKEIVDMVLDKDNIFQKFVIDQNQGFCLMMLPVDDPGPCLLGAFQQANFKILYDVKNWLLYFVHHHLG
ncbi:hypothetical protein Cgig2_000105 [Carnegiea gigantea]|uniref:Peptidase A1 domain-containing protein n=1 Tax=Carnegiea gigantea TaxID=171969 RepID=A0A9Q1KXA2_9CARY|nr:hypothetical protein Cgig2_000105 [Carnegiea gigantea]